MFAIISVVAIMILLVGIVLNMFFPFTDISWQGTTCQRTSLWARSSIIHPYDNRRIYALYFIQFTECTAHI